MRRTAVLVALTLIAGLIGLTSPAYAEKHKATDNVGDVMTIGEELEEVAAPNNTDADIVKSAVRHGQNRVVVKVKLRDLHRASRDGYQEIFVPLKTSSGPRFGVLTQDSQGHARVEILILKRRKEKFVRCPGADAQVSAKKDLMRVSIPRKCLSYPRWIRAGVSTFFSDGLNIAYDDAFRSGSSVTGSQSLTPKLRRG